MSAALEHLLTWADHHPTNNELTDLFVAFHLDSWTAQHHQRRRKDSAVTITEHIKVWFAGTHVYDDDPCQVCGRAVCGCFNEPEEP